jgi:hypothetical protein
MKMGLRFGSLRMSSAVVDVLAICAVLTAMLIANVEWVFTRLDWIDTWMYFGFFQHYNVPDFLAGNKKIARLPWILLGFVVNKLGPPETTSFILHVGLFALGAFCFYRLALQMFGRIAAVIATLTYITWVPIHGFGGWDYHNTLLPVLYFLAYRTLVWATNTERRPFANFFNVGVLLALSIHTNIFVILLVPALLIRGVHGVRTWLTPELNLRRWLQDASAGIVLGGLGITAVLGAINVAFGRPFLFPQILVSRSAFLLGHPVDEKSWWLPWSDPWWLNEIHTPMFDAMLILAIVYLMIGLRRWSLKWFLASNVACALVEYVVSLGVFAIGQTMGHPLLQPFYMAMPVVMPMFLALAALLSDVCRQPTGVADPHRLPGRQTTALVLFAALAFGVQFVGRLSIIPALFTWGPVVWNNLPPLLLILGGFVVATTIARRFPGGTRRMWIAYGCIAVSLGQANTVWPIPNEDRAPYDFREPCTVRRALLSAVAGVDDVLFPLAQSGRQILPWYHSGEFVGNKRYCRLTASSVGDPLFAMGYGEYVNYPAVERATNMPQRVVDALVPGKDVVALITNDDAYVLRTLSRLQHRDPIWRVSGAYRVGNQEMMFGLHLISADPVVSERLAFRAEPQNGSVITTPSPGAIHVAFPKTPWTYAATLRPRNPLPSNTGTMVVTVRILSGTAAVGVLNRTGTDFLAREIVHSGAKPVNVYLHLNDWHAAGPLLIETAANPGSTEGTVSSLAFTPESRTHAR